MLQMAQHPDIQVKVREEVKSIWSSESDTLTWEMLEDMTYCECVIKETLRYTSYHHIIYHSN